MADTLTFEISYLYVDSTEGIAIPVALVSPNGIYNTWAKVDTGAEVCLFSNEVGLRLGLDVERGIPRSLGSAGGTMIDSFGHEVVIQTFGIAMSSTSPQRRGESFYNSCRGNMKLIFLTICTLSLGLASQSIKLHEVKRIYVGEIGKSDEAERFRLLLEEQLI
jgi:hypothetical protein